jgi:dTDP-4-amino-4,6-dideoxygalactose transaminase
MTDLITPRQIPFLDLGAIHEPLADEFRRVFDHVLATGAFVGGPYVEQFEADWAAYCEAEHAIGVANGTDALELALRALGITVGDEVIIPGNTFIATAEAAIAVGATPVFVDVDPDTLLVDPEAVDAAVTDRTAAIIPVHLYGQMADMHALRRVADRYGLALVEDAAQAHGARWKGQRAGTLGDMACFSFYPGKNLGALGDAGAVVTNDAVLAQRVRLFSNHGRDAESKYLHPYLGRNSRLDGMQAGFLSVKLAHLDAWTHARRGVAAVYRDVFDQAAAAGAPAPRFVAEDPRALGVYHLAVVEVDDRAAVAQGLGARGVQTGIHYPIPCHEQPAYAHLRTRPLPVVEASAPRILSLPMSPDMDADASRYVAESLLAVLAEQHGEG